jgi:hypothetical protein
MNLLRFLCAMPPRYTLRTIEGQCASSGGWRWLHHAIRVLGISDRPQWFPSLGSVLHLPCSRLRMATEVKQQLWRHGRVVVSLLPSPVANPLLGASAAAPPHMWEEQGQPARFVLSSWAARGSS